MPTVSRTMKTCRSLHLAGARYLLRGGVSLDTDSDSDTCRMGRMASFVAFMQADHPHRYPLLRNLSMSFYDRSEYESQPDLLSDPAFSLLKNLFMDISAYSTNFNALTLVEADEILGAHPDLLHAIASIRTVKELWVAPVGPHSRRMLRNFSSAVVSAYLDMYMEEEDPTMDGEARDVTLLLHNSQHTLEKLEVNNHMVSFNGPRYLHVTVLVLDLQQVLRTHDFARAFPNLHTLDLQTSFIITMPPFATDDEDGTFSRHRNTNIALQRAHGTWRTLKEVSGSPMILYALGLLCPVTALNITDGIHDSSDDVRVFREIVQHARPSHLHVTVSGGSSLVSGSECASVFHEQYVRQVRSLDIRVNLHPFDVSANIAADAMLVSFHPPVSRKS